MTHSAPITVRIRVRNVISVRCEAYDEPAIEQALTHAICGAMLVRGVNPDQSAPEAGKAASLALSQSLVKLLSKQARETHSSFVDGE
jgi:hypothetical protein